MPELPEIETIKRQFNRKIKGKTIKKVEVFLPKLVKYPLKEFKKLVQGKKITNAFRRGKLLILELSNNYCLIIHLKLSGQIVFNREENKHTHLIYFFKDGSRLLHNDLRQFGFVKVIPKKELNNFFEKEKLGIEPLSDDFKFNIFKELLLKRKKSTIKTLLMNQSFISGIGNIYANEILFFAGVMPDRKVKTLKDSEIKKIFQGIKKILALAIKRKGSSNRDYVDIYGKKGNFIPLIKVYQREKKPCFRCKTKIKKMKLGNRSSFFCLRCQK